MAEFIPRTIDTIFQEILNDKQNYSSLDVFDDGGISDEQTFLDAVSSDSKVSIWILLSYLQARTQWVTDQVMLTQVEELEEIRDSSFIGNTDWYAFIALQWQYGDVLIIDSEDFSITFEVIDPSKQLVGSATVEEIAGKVLIKIRGANADLLSEDELNSFITYMNKVKFAGTKLIIKNENADKLKIIATILYDGERVLTDLQSDVDAAINEYITNLPFNSDFVKNDLIDAVQAVEGVNDIEINILQGRLDSGSFEDIIHRYKADAGYCAIDSNFPLTSSLTYKIG